MEKNKTIPVIDLDGGIKESLDNAMRILEASTRLNMDPREIVIALYYYALEEFGKAVILRAKKQDALSRQEYEIPVEDFFYDHDKKIEAAKSIIGKNADIIKYAEPPADFEFHELKEEGPILHDFQDRSNMFLTNYNHNTKKWREPLPLLLSDSILNATIILEKTIKEWQT